MGKRATKGQVDVDRNTGSKKRVQMRSKTRRIRGKESNHLEIVVKRFEAERGRLESQNNWGER